MAVMECMFVFQKNSYVETLIFNVVVFVDGAFERWLDQEAIAWMIYANKTVIC